MPGGVGGRREQSRLLPDLWSMLYVKVSVNYRNRSVASGLLETKRLIQLLLSMRLFVTDCLYGEYVGVERIDEDVSLLWYYDYLLGQMDHRKWQISPVKNQPLSSAASCGAKRT